MAWVATSLARKLVVRLSLVLGGVSILFLVLLVVLYRQQMLRTQGEVLSEVNGLLRVSLENAMLKRDLPGLRDIVRRLGERPDIVSVMIVNPDREVRFASHEHDLGRVLTAAVEEDCVDCLGEPNALSPTTRMISMAGDGDILRSIVPVPNRAPCKECHGDASEHPVNGVLVVDQAASGIRRQALTSFAVLGFSGLFVILLVGGAGAALLRADVVQPISRLYDASRSLSDGHLDTRVSIAGKDELAELGASFNEMAARLESSLKAIRERESFLQAMIDAIPDGIRVIDEDYNVVMVNSAYRGQQRSDVENLVGQPCYAAHGRDEPCIPTLETCPFHALGDGEMLKYMHRHIDASGKEIIVETTADRIVRRDADGRERVLIVEAMRDVGQQVRYSQEQRLAELGQLATGIAHEVYNPLSSVRLGLQALLRQSEKDAGLSEKTVDYLRLVDGEVTKCIEVTNRLLSLSLPPSKHLQLVSLKQVIDDTTSLLRYEAEQRGIDVDLRLGSEDARIFATESEMRMILLNLVQNAFHAMPDGGTVTIARDVEDGFVELSIGDTGVGIPAETLAHIFDPFFSKRADREQGTGLGLTIVKAVVARYRGKISIDSQVGVGTTFTLRFPEAGTGEIPGMQPDETT
ncbi:MAG: histidine kinase [Hyphomicrobiales bacterium]|nr:MAG: histidine kinase [Hyphomicrobiales bacterium]